MRRFGMGGVRETADARMARELSPEEEDRAVDVVANILPKLLPNLRVRKLAQGERHEPSTAENKFDKFDLLFSFNGYPAIGMRATSETRQAPREQLKNEFRNNPFVTTPFTENDLPRALIYIDPGQIDGHYMNDPKTEQKLSEQILKTFQLSLEYALTKTQLREEKERLQKLLVEVMAKQTELTTIH